jgi:hypothetical protein
MEVSRTDHSCHATDEPDEAEPSLGWVGIGQGIHGLALPGYADDREEENEHGGDVLDEPRDAEVEGDCGGEPYPCQQCSPAGTSP